MKNMKEVRTEEEYLGRYSGYTKKDMLDFLDKLFDKAKYLNNPKVFFESTIDPYDDYASDVKVYVKGWRPMTKEEIDEKSLEENSRKEINKLSEKLGVTYYEASTIYRLKEAGKI